MNIFYNVKEKVEIYENQKQDFDTIIIDADELISDIKSEISKIEILQSNIIINDKILTKGTVFNYSNIEDFYPIINRKISFIKENFNPKKIVFCLSSFNNFRKKIDRKYKEKDTYMKVFLNNEIRYMLIDFVEKYNDFYSNMEIYLNDKLEADDLINIYATSHKEEKILIISQDKDMQTIANVSIYNPKKSSLMTTTLQSAFIKFCCQLLEGDKQDNVIGLKAFGSVKSEKFVNDLCNRGLNGYQILLAIKKEYVRQKRQYDFQNNFNLLKLLHHKQFDFSSFEVKIMIADDLVVFEKITF